MHRHTIPAVAPTVAAAAAPDLADLVAAAAPDIEAAAHDLAAAVAVAAVAAPAAALAPAVAALAAAAMLAVAAEEQLHAGTTGCWVLLVVGAATADGITHLTRPSAMLLRVDSIVEPLPAHPSPPAGVEAAGSNELPQPSLVNGSLSLAPASK